MHLIQQKPQYFAGQIVDYRDFNRLVLFSENAVASLCLNLFPGGGIISGAGEEFNPVPAEGLKVKVQSGGAVLPNGKLISSTEPLEVDLSKLVLSSGEHLIRVGLRSKERGENYYQDRDDPAVFGYRTGLVLPSVVVTVDQKLTDAIELFRVKLSAGISQIRIPSTVEGNLSPGLGEINTHHQKMIDVQGNFPGETESAADWRAALGRFEHTLYQINLTFLFEDPVQLGVLISLLHYELLNRPFRLERMDFLVRDVAKRMCLYIERLLRQITSKITAEERDRLLEIIFGLEKLRKPVFSSRECKSRLQMDELIRETQRLSGWMQSFGTGFDFVSKMKHALREVTHRKLTEEDRITLLGYTFNKVDSIRIDSKHSKNADRVEVKGPQSNMRIVSAKYSNEDAVQLRGVFIKEGRIDINVEVTQVDRPLILMFENYIRRKATPVQYEWNGRDIQGNAPDQGIRVNSWVNLGLVIPSEYLIQGSNKLIMKLKEPDLDFGFFGLVAYQPVLSNQEFV